MKILFINKYDTTGGAGLAAFRLHKALEENFKTENYFLVGIKNSNLSFVYPTRKPGLKNYIERGINYLSNLAGLQYFWLPFSYKTIIEKTREIKPDIIHLHNAHGGYFELSLLPELSKIAPIVWTLHDMWVFTANAAHTFGDESWKKLKAGEDERKHFPAIGLPLGNYLIKRKKKIYSKSNLTIVCPSKWLYNLAVQSPAFEGKRIEQIYNGVDLDIFKPMNKKSIRQELNIPVDSEVLMFGAEKLDNEFKGGKDLENILNALSKKVEREIHIIILGKGSKPQYSMLNPPMADQYSNFVLHFPGYINNELQLAKYYNAADIFIYPTKADNLPSTLIEAIACGVPCISNDIGGCKEIITDGENGFLIPEGNNELFARKILLLLRNFELKRKFSEKCSDIAEEKFSVNQSSSIYMNLCKELLNVN